jgi:putative transcriptional regulator
MMTAKPIDVKKLREGLRLSQPEFASRYGFNLHTLRKWEQGQRHPIGGSLTLLRMISKSPDIVREAVGAA